MRPSAGRLTLIVNLILKLTAVAPATAELSLAETFVRLAAVTVGSVVGMGLVGSGVGAGTGSAVGTGTGNDVGAGTGSFVGAGTGSAVGAGTGNAVGAGTGSVVGAGTGSVVGAGTGNGVP